MKISVVIPAYNEEKYIGGMLVFLKKIELGKHRQEILVINGDSSDWTTSLVV